MDNPAIESTLIQLYADGPVAPRMDPSSCASDSHDIQNQPLLSLSQAALAPTSECTMELSSFASQNPPDTASGQPFYQLDLNFEAACYTSAASLGTPDCLYHIGDNLDSMETKSSALLSQTVYPTRLFSYEVQSTYLAASGDFQPSQPSLLTASVPDTVINNSLHLPIDFSHGSDPRFPILASTTVEPWLLIEGQPTVDTSGTLISQSLIMDGVISTPASACQHQPTQQVILPPPLVAPSSSDIFTHQQLRSLDTATTPLCLSSITLSKPDQGLPDHYSHLDQGIMSAYQCQIIGDSTNPDTFSAISYAQSPHPVCGAPYGHRVQSYSLHTRSRSTSVSSIPESSGAIPSGHSPCTVDLRDVQQNMTENPHLRPAPGHALILPCSASPPQVVSTPHGEHSRQLWPPNGVLPSMLALRTPSIASVLSNDAQALSSTFTLCPTQTTYSPISFEDMDNLADHLALNCPGDAMPSSAYTHTCDMKVASPEYLVAPYQVASYKRRQMAAYARWTIQEDRQLADAVEAAANHLQVPSTSSSHALDWHFISSMVPTRSPTQCHARWSKVLAEQRRTRKITCLPKNCSSGGNSNDSSSSDSSQDNSAMDLAHQQHQTPLPHLPNRSRSATSCSTVSTVEETHPFVPQPDISPPSSSPFSSSSPSSLSSTLTTPSSSATLLEPSPMLGIRRGRWTSDEDQELMALVDQYLAENGNLVLLPPPPLSTSTPSEDEIDWSTIQNPLYQQQATALQDPTIDPNEQRSRGVPDWFMGDTAEYERLVDATIANIPWGQLVLRMTPRPLVSTSAADEKTEEEKGDNRRQHREDPRQDQHYHPMRLGHRLGVQAQARWAEALDPRVRRDPWTPVEDALLRRAVQECAKCWIKISEWIPGRTQRQCRTRWVHLTVRAERVEAKRLVQEQVVKAQGQQQHQQQQQQQQQQRQKESAYQRQKQKQKQKQKHMTTRKQKR
ncbi:Myb-like DNA-binding domain protein [Actinomortierella ambigua]|nr:Myb-like DNA-binding domain protein [Actinomortierella ambigua]